MKIRLSFLVLGLVALLGSLLASSQRIAAYEATDRLAATAASGPSVLGTGKAPLGAAIPAPGIAFTYTTYLPVILKMPPSIATPGYWLGDDLAHEFYVTPDAAYVRNHAVYIKVTGCGSYKIWHAVDEPILSNHYSFTGSYYGSGTFYSATTATATDGLSHLYISGCGYVSGGPWTANMYWYSSSQPALAGRVVGQESNGSQPALAARVVGPAIGSPIPADHAVEVVKLD